MIFFHRHLFIRWMRGSIRWCIMWRSYLIQIYLSLLLCSVNIFCIEYPWKIPLNFQRHHVLCNKFNRRVKKFHCDEAFVMDDSSIDWVTSGLLGWIEFDNGMSYTSFFDEFNIFSMLDHSITHVVIKCVRGWCCGISIDCMEASSPFCARLPWFSVMVEISESLVEINWLRYSIDSGGLAKSCRILLGLLLVLVPLAAVFAILILVTHLLSLWIFLYSATYLLIV